MFNLLFRHFIMFLGERKEKLDQTYLGRVVLLLLLSLLLLWLGSRPILLLLPIIGMKMDRNEREDPSIIFVSVFYYENGSEIVGNGRENKIYGLQMDENRKIYLNTLLFDHLVWIWHYTLFYAKLFSKYLIKVSCFLRLNREVHRLMLTNKRGYDVPIKSFLNFITGSSRIKIRSRKYLRDTPLHALLNLFQIL